MPQIVVTKDVLTADEHINLGIAYESKGEIELAIKEYKKALEKDNNYAMAYFNLGNVYLKNGSYDEAEKHYLSAIEKSPSNGIFYNNLAWLYIYGKNDLKAAERFTKTAIDIDPSKKYIYLDTLGVIYTYKKDFKEAEDVFKNALDLVPQGDAQSLIHIYLHMADLYSKMGDIEKLGDARKKTKELNFNQKTPLSSPQILLEIPLECP